MFLLFCCFYSPELRIEKLAPKPSAFPGRLGTHHSERLESALTGALRASRCCGHTLVVLHSKSSLRFPVHSSLQSPRLAQQNFEVSFLESRCWPPWLVRSWIISFILRLSLSLARPTFVHSERGSLLLLPSPLNSPYSPSLCASSRFSFCRLCCALSVSLLCQLNSRIVSSGG